VKYLPESFKKVLFVLDKISTLNKLLANDDFRRLRDLIEPDYGFPGCLCECGVIINNSWEQIIQKQDICERVDMLLETLCGKFHYLKVHEALKKTRQLHVSNYIRYVGSELVAF
jgi:hypothetical protein